MNFIIFYGGLFFNVNLLFSVPLYSGELLLVINTAQNSSALITITKLCINVYFVYISYFSRFQLLHWKYLNMKARFLMFHG